MRVKVAIVIVVLQMLTISAYASTFTQGVETTIKDITTYNQGSAAGDIRITVFDTVPGCESGYFIVKDTPGLKETLSLSLSALHAGSKVIINGYAGVTWSATSRTDYCEIHNVIVIK